MVTETIQPIVGTFDRNTGELLGIGPAGVSKTPVGGLNLSSIFAEFSPENYAGTVNQRLALATAAAEAVGGVVVLKAQDYVLTEPWIIPNNVDVAGVHPARTVFKPSVGYCGPMIVSWPSYEDPKHTIRRVGIQGGMEGVFKSTGTVTKDSNVVTNIPVNDISTFKVGDKLEGIGLDMDTFITAVDVGNRTLTVTNVGKFYRTGITVATDTKIVRREGYEFTATVGSTSGNAVLTVTAGNANMQYLKKWMYAAGTNLDSDSDDLSANNRIMAFDAVAGTITLDRPAKTLGSFSLRVWVEVEGFVAPEVFYNPALTGNKVARCATFDNCYGSGLSGTVFRIRPQRDQFHAVNGCRAEKSHGYGYDITASNDSQIDNKSGGGANWKSAFKISSSATFRWGGGECWDTQLTHIYTDGRVQGCRQFTASMGDVNGRWYIKGKGTDAAGEPNQVSVSSDGTGSGTKAVAGPTTALTHTSSWMLRTSNW